MTKQNMPRLTESQLFTIEALNKIQGFVWPKEATHASMDAGTRVVDFWTAEPRPLQTPSAFDGPDGSLVDNDVYAKSKHPDWRGSLISKEQFDSVNGWVRCDGCVPVSGNEIVQVSLNFGVSGGKTDSASKFAWGDGGITHWRHHKRDLGWYLVKRYEAANWEPAEYVGSDSWLIAGVESEVLLGDGDLIINEARLLITPDGGVISITSFPMNAQVSVDVSIGDDDAFNRIFGKVIDFSVSNGEPVLIVEMTERNFQGRINQSSIAKEKVMQVIDAADDVISALAGKNEDVHPLDSGKMVELYDRLNDEVATPEVVRELACMALTLLNSGMQETTHE